jgi:hypothetical protein
LLFFIAHTDVSRRNAVRQYKEPDGLRVGCERQEKYTHATEFWGRGEAVGKCPPGRPRIRWEGNIEIELRETDYEYGKRKDVA